MPSPFFAAASHRLNLRALLGTSNISDVDAGFAALVADAEANVAGYAEGASLPAAGISGRIFRMTDGTDRFFVDDGSTWQLLLPQSQAGVFVNQGANMNWNNAYSRLEPRDTVRLRGALNATATVTSGTTIGTVAAGYRPAAGAGVLARVNIPGIFDGAASLIISPSGAMTLGGNSLTNGSTVSFDGITYTL